MGTSASSGGSPTVVSPRTAEDNPRRGRARTFTVQRPISSAEALSTLILDMLEAREPSLASGRGLDLFMYENCTCVYRQRPSPERPPLRPPPQLLHPSLPPPWDPTLSSNCLQIRPPSPALKTHQCHSLLGVASGRTTSQDGGSQNMGKGCRNNFLDGTYKAPMFLFVFNF